MATSRANLDEQPGNYLYLVLGILLIVMSVLGWFLFQKLQPAAPSPSTENAGLPDLIPSIIPEISTISSSPPIPTSFTSEPSPTVKTSPAKIPTAVLSPSVSLTPTPAFSVLNSPESGFTVNYPSYRKLYQTSEGSGQRFTLYSPRGAIAIHAGPAWSWSHPDRQFSDAFLISGQSTFVYETDTQIIVDLQKGDSRFTIQCVHNKLDIIRSECQQIFESFQVL